MEDESYFWTVSRYIWKHGKGNLADRMTSATLRDLATRLGLGRPESVSNLTRRIDRDLEKDSRLRIDVDKIERQLSDKTNNKV